MEKRNGVALYLHDYRGAFSFASGYVKSGRKGDTNSVIMSKAKAIEERHFYITLCIKESYSQENWKDRWNAPIMSVIFCQKKKYCRNR